MNAASGPAFSGAALVGGGFIGGALGGGLEIEKPSEKYADEMTGPGAWPETPESVFDERKQMLTAVKSAVTEARANWDNVRALVFNGLWIWTGGGATAASMKTDTHSKAMGDLETQLTAAIQWCDNASAAITMAKKAIANYVNTELGNIDQIERNADVNTDTTQDVQAIVDRAYNTNKNYISLLADAVSGKLDLAEVPPPSEIPDPDDVNQPDDGLPDVSSLLSSRSDITEAFSENPAQQSMVEQASAGAVRNDVSEGFSEDPAQQSMVEQASAGAVRNDAGEGFSQDSAPPPIVSIPGGQQPSSGPKFSPSAPGVPAAPSAPSAPSAPGAPGAPSVSPLGGSSGGGAPASPLGDLASAAADTPAGLDPTQAGLAGQAPVNPAQQFAQSFANSAQPQPTMNPASATVAPPSPVVDAPPPPTSGTAGASGTGSGHAPVAPPPSSGGSAMGAGASPAMPLGAPPMAPPAAPAAPSAPAAPAPVAPPASSAMNAGAQVAAVPVSAARAERDAAQNAARRSGSNPLELARRIAAALNAPDMVNSADYNFFWITAVAADGKIVVANNYGLAYIPEQVQLPEQVAMASADESISPAERASWVTHPIVAVQRWAQHRDTDLRAVIGTEDQFKNSDAGVHQEVLTPEDIPASGKMAGRDRLQVIAPQIAARLAQMSDADLVNVLPPAPTDANPPEDRRTALWDKVWQPLASRSAKRGGRHLRAFVDYAAHAQEQAVYTAHTAAVPEDQRRAVSDFIYWQHVGQLIADAIAQQETAKDDQQAERPTG